MNKSDSEMVSLAILNNVAWCKCVASSSKVASDETEELWWAKHPMPPYFPNLVTKDLTADEKLVLNTMCSLSPYFVKDSFNALHLDDKGFEKLFEAQWYACDFVLEQSCEASEAEDFSLHKIACAEQLVEWEKAWQGDFQSLVYPPSIVDNPAVEFHLCRHGDLSAGLTLFVTGASIGIYNLWGTDELIARLLSQVSRSIPQLPIVGYGDKEELSMLAKLGFCSLSKLAVWGKFS